MAQPNARQRAERRARKLRRDVHEALDAIWLDTDPEANRVACYDAMALVLDLPRAECHVRLFDEDQCRRALANMDRIREEAARLTARDEREFMRLSARELSALRLASSGVKPTPDAHRDVKSERRMGRTLRKLHRRGYLCKNPHDPEAYLLSARGRHALSVVGSRGNRSHRRGDG